MMLKIKGTELNALPIVDLEWVQDLENFDGPLLSLFKHRRQGDSYLYYWCDCNKEVNRWMVLRVSETNIIRLINRLIPLDQVIPKGCQDDFVYFVDLDGDSKEKKVYLQGVDAIPAKYIPVQGAFLNADVAQRLGSYSVIIERNLSIDMWRDFFREFSYAYAFIYNLVALKSQKIKGHPWRGGFSAMHFWRELLQFIPTEDAPSLETVHYASPGFVRFKLNSDIAVQVGNLIARYLQSNEKIDEDYRDLNAYIRTHDLNNETITVDDSRWNQHNPKLTELTLALLGSLHIPSPDEFVNAAHRPFEAAKMATSFTRRLMELASLESNRLIRFPNLIIPG